jgi:hypothetical protein
MNSFMHSIDINTAWIRQLALPHIYMIICLCFSITFKSGSYLPNTSYWQQRTKGLHFAGAAMLVTEEVGHQHFCFGPSAEHVSNSTFHGHFFVVNSLGRKTPRVNPLCLNSSRTSHYFKIDSKWLYARTNSIAKSESYRSDGTVAPADIGMKWNAAVVVVGRPSLTWYATRCGILFVSTCTNHRDACSPNKKNRGPSPPVSRPRIPQISTPLPGPAPATNNTTPKNTSNTPISPTPEPAANRRPPGFRYANSDPRRTSLPRLLFQLRR